ncbi:hypothetical protein SUGI_1182140 [Cryptomeria japonica]|uniref:uncharacterized protein LOC131080107 n=1 Tax=Cryptomeria japonica TaxID=3369 RepID=UPI00241492FF|nr:uncharacterized protein LOC131080107 [Cryptomeria japonica]GLJ55073.1 hypothetical protein SUGI_1182140 [Cryptomeria japonica]
MEKKSGSAPATGCYKCGRAGHWSRDCPFSTSDNVGQGKQAVVAEKPAQAPKVKKKIRRTITPDLLLSNEGLGYVLEHIPRMVQIKGRGHEVTDLGNLMEAYIHWHSLMLPSVSFPYFVDKVEKVGCTKRVRTCIRELRERVANGENPKTLHEPPTEPIPAFDDMVDGEVGFEAEQDKVVAEDDIIEEDLFDELYRQATGEEAASSKIVPDADVASQSVRQSSPTLNTREEQGIQPPGNDAHTQTSQTQISEEQKSRMEANKQKALERAAARAAAQLQSQ